MPDRILETLANNLLISDVVLYQGKIVGIGESHSGDIYVRFQSGDISEYRPDTLVKIVLCNQHK